MPKIELAPKGHTYHGSHGWNRPVNTSRIAEVHQPVLHSKGGCSLTIMVRKKRRSKKTVPHYLYFSDFFEYCAKYGKMHVAHYMWNSELVAKGRTLALQHATELRNNLLEQR